MPVKPSLPHHNHKHKTRHGVSSPVISSSWITVFESVARLPRSHCHLNIPFNFRPALWAHDLVGAASRSRIRSV